MLLAIGVVIAEFFAAVLFVLFEIEVCARMDAFDFFKAERESVFDVDGGIGVMGEIFVGMKL